MTKGGRKPKRKQFENLCEFCNKFITGGSYNFKSHLFLHNAIKARFSCDICLKKFYRKDSYRVHVNRHHGTIPRKKYICDYCDRAFVLKNSLISHLKRIHDENLDTDLGKFACHVCNLVYCEKRLLDRHIRRKHFNLQFTKQPLHTQKSVNETWIENVVNKNATVSITKVNENRIVIRPLKIDVDIKDNKLNRVNYRSECIDQYSMGVCDYCNKEMVKKSLLTHIREVHMNLRKFKCEVCNETFSRHYQLSYHICGRFKSKKAKMKKYIVKKTTKVD